ncbi:phospholipase D2 [Diorhabda carinulata]|uniref:phospholipase D2 n=1 Tax=Diorhabda carinulata TaxID=1163345 RepID=UPI0025A136E0|nr:phospholipase D2 [Diorhabda carinulata]
MENKDENETEESGDYNETSINRPSLGSLGSDGDYDDILGVPRSIKILDIGDGPVAIEHSDEELEEDGIEHIGFNAVHNYKKFSSMNRDVFIPGVDVSAIIVDYERNLTSHMLNPNLYTISLVHGNFNWQIKKRYKHLQSLHQQLVLFKTGLNIPFPTKTHKNKRKSVKQNVKKTTSGKRKMALPRFPKKPEVLVSYERIGNRMKQIESYLNNLLSIPIYRNHSATIEFLEVSHLSFVEGLGSKGKEGYVKKRTGSTNPGQTGCNCFGLYHCVCCVRMKYFCNDLICSRYVKRWFFVKDTYFGYINPKNGRIKAVVLFDQGFEVASGIYALGVQNSFQVQSLCRNITFKCWTKRKSKEWTENLKEVAATTAREFVYPNRYRSYAPIRVNVTASWFVDGCSYMSAVADAIENAKEEVFITDWWLSPEINLKRPAILGDYWQLKRLLERKADSGVKIYVLLYKEVEMALGLNSYYSKQKLTESSSNIKVLRHPDHAKTGIFLWAHHEKLVIVDQTYAFIGGIDLCYGRWDDNKHRLTDLGSVTPSINTSTLKKKSSNVPTGDTIYPIPVPYYKQTRNLDIDEPDNEVIKVTPDLPELEPGDHLLIPITHGHPVKMNTPQLERKHANVHSVIDNLKIKGKELMNLVYTPHEHETLSERDSTETKLDETDARTPEEIIDTLDGSAKLWIGKDYVNFIVKDFTNLDSPFDDFIDRSTTPRMPWHDIGMCVQGDAARDAARHFIQRWNSAKLEKAKNNDMYNYLLPKSYDNYKTLPVEFPNKTHKVSCQLLRSVSCWSAGFLEADTIEQSIHEAYIDTITKAQHYIYIENQFFISLSCDNPFTKNQIGEALYKRIIRAYKAKEVFRVYIVMPLLPGFEGEVGGPSGTSLHAITHWNYLSISKGKDAILNRLKDAGIEDPSDYITFYGLRTHSTLNSEPITELIYVHSKLMIVDDKKVICGSANINDRSLIGKRDSEVAVLIEDETFEDGIMNGSSFPCGKFAGSLRKHLFKEHLGLLDEENEVFEDVDVRDPVSESFYREVWYKTADLNTEFYDKIFHVIPTNTVETFGDLKRNHEEKPLWVDEFSRAEKMLDSIQGHLVLLPLNFLSKEYLMPAVNSAEGWMPTSLWI